MSIISLQTGKAIKTTVYRTLEEYPEFMKVKDVQEYLRIGENATYDFLHHPKCPVLRFGNSIRIRKEKLLQFIQELENGGAGNE